VNLRQRIDLIPESRRWLNTQAVNHHYMHRPIHDRACPFGWRITFDGLLDMPDGKPCGFIIFASVHFVRLKGVFGYPGLPTRWQVLSLARLWLHDELPPMSETCVIAKAHKLVQRRWLEVHPPKFLDQPYHILKIISYADNEFHKGTIYEAANYKLSGKTTSARRHKNTRGPGMDGHELTRYVYDLPEPRWDYSPVIQQSLFEVML
jgi:hypothetical protein